MQTCVYVRMGSVVLFLCVRERLVCGQRCECECECDGVVFISVHMLTSSEYISVDALYMPTYGSV